MHTVQTWIEEYERVTARNIEAISAMLGFHARSARRLIDAFDESQRFMASLGEHGWGVPAHSTAVSTYNEAFFENAKDYDKAEKIIADYYDGLVESFAAVISDQPALTPWARASTDAAEAHRRGQYALAIPLWLILIEATVAELRRRSSNPRAQSYKTFTNRSLNKYIGTFEALFDEKSVAATRLILAKTLSAMGQSAKEAHKYGSVVNRNEVMHGIKAVTSREDSLRVLSVLYALVDEAMYDESSAARTARSFIDSRPHV
jgi:hypothetical protein